MSQISDVRIRQYQAFTGGQPPEPFPIGDYLEVKRSEGYERTANQDAWTLWDAINREAQGFSSTAPALTPVISNDVVAGAINGINRIFAATNAMVISRANRMFSDTFGGPATYSYESYAIRWPGEQRFAMTVALDFVSAAYQLIHVRSNCVDNGLLEEHAITVLRPLFMRKMSIMRSLFGMEVKGDISPNELTAIFRGSNVTPPLTSSFDDLRDLSAEYAAEDSQALTNESAPTPDEATMVAITSGVEVWTWVPTSANWATFGEILRRSEHSAPTLAPAEPFPFSTGVISGAGTTGPAATGPAGGLVIPT